MPFWGELRRRNVVKAGLAYLVVAWLIAQVVDLVLPTFDAPPWVIRTIILLLILGLPVVLIVAWAFEITPDGIKRTSTVPESESITPKTGQRLNYAIIAALAFAVVFLVIDNYVLSDSNEPAASSNTTPPDDAAEEQGVLPNSIAVLPFANLSPNPEDAYFAAGIHDEILNQLGKLRMANALRAEFSLEAGLDAMISLARGDRAATLSALETAVAKIEREELDSGFYELMNIKSNVLGHPMLDEPRFRELRGRLGSL